MDAPEAAERFLSAVEAAIDRVIAMPHIGSPRSLKNKSPSGLRCWQVGDGFEEISIYYRVHDDLLRVIRVLHGKRDVLRILEKETKDEGDLLH